MSVYFLTKTIETKNLKYLIYFAIFLSLTFVTKETVIILAPVFLLILIFNYKELKKIKYKETLAVIIFSISIFLIIYLLFFSSFLTNPKGFSDSFKGYMPWTDRGINEIGHDKPFYYYIILLTQYELPLLILGLIGIYFVFKKNSIFYKNIAIWFIILFLVYSFIPYKTPWLIINITLPLCFLASITINEFYQSKKYKILALIILIITLIYLLIFSIALNFVYPYQPNNKFAYAHTDKDILNLVSEVKKQNNPNILIASKDYWPLPYYLREYKVSYQSLEYFNESSANTIIKNYDFLILSKKNLDNLNLSDKLYPKFTLRKGISLYLIKN